MRFVTFIAQNARWLGAASALVAASSFGQTFFISLFAGNIRSDFGLSHGDWGTIYGSATVVSAGLMLWLGGLADRFRVRRIAAAVLILLAAMCLLMASSLNAIWIWLAVLGLRFSGQGMLSHLSVVGVGRWFRANRGRAYSVMTAAFALCEAVLPITAVALVAAIGWRSTWVLAAAGAAMFIPLIRWLLRVERDPKGTAEQDITAGMMGKHWTRSDALRHWLFWLCLPGLLAQPMISTAFFFQTVHLVEVKGWSLAAYAALFPVYTASNLTALYFGGGLVDRVGSARVMPLYLLPFAAGLLVISLGGQLWAAAIALGAAGIMHGLAASAVNTFWPEFFGSRHLGSVRSVASSLMVFASAIGPVATGWMIDSGIGYETQLQMMAGYCLSGSALYFVALSRARRLLPPAT